MIQHKISAWIATLAAVLVSIGCYLLAEELGRPLLYREVELPLLARVFYTDARWIYFFPAPFGLWASIYSLRGKVEAAIFFPLKR